jgi:hypothetical protein
MTLLTRLLILIAAFAGSGLLIWKGWDGMVFFLHDLVASTLKAGQEVPRFLPTYLVTTLGIALISLSQIGATWTLSPKLKILGVLRGVLLLVSSGAFIYAVSGVIGTFRNLASSGSADPTLLETQLGSIAVFFYTALGSLLLSTFIGSVGTFDRSQKSGGGIVKAIETAVWIVSTLISLGLIFNYRAVDLMLSGGVSGSADPAKLAGFISTNLNGQLAWSILLGLLGILAIAATALTKPVSN